MNIYGTAAEVARELPALNAEVCEKLKETPEYLEIFRETLWEAVYRENARRHLKQVYDMAAFGAEKIQEAIDKGYEVEIEKDGDGGRVWVFYGNKKAAGASK